MNEVNVYCIIVTYNAMKWIDKCLESLRGSSIKIHPVIIDNSSKDETVSHITNKYFEVHLIVNEKNRGFGQANNQGIEYAYKQGATHFFLLNQDTWVHKGAIEKLVEVQDKYEISLVSPLHLNGKGDLLDYSYFVKIVIEEINREYVSDLILDKIKPYYRVFSINAAAWMISRKTIERIGGFDPIYFHYGEDGNYCQRVKYHQGQVAFVTGSYIHHDRDLHGNNKAYNQYSLMMMLLYEYANVNIRLIKITKNRLYFHLHIVKLLIVYLFTFHFKSFWHTLAVVTQFYWKIPSIMRSIKINRQIGSHWLNLESK